MQIDQRQGPKPFEYEIAFFPKISISDHYSKKLKYKTKLCLDLDLVKLKDLT